MREEALSVLDRRYQTVPLLVGKPEIERLTVEIMPSGETRTQLEEDFGVGSGTFDRRDHKNPSLCRLT